MRKGNSTIRRGAALVAMALGMLTITGSGAGAAATNLADLDILNGHSDAAALDIEVTLPGSDELVAALSEAGLPTEALPSLGIEGVTIRQRVSLVNGDVQRAVEEGAADIAKGWAAVTQGLLGGDEPTAETQCSGTKCGDAKATHATRIDLPLSLGHIILNGAESATTSLVDTRNNTALAQVLVDPRELIGDDGMLAAVGDALDMVTQTFNGSVRPVVNDTIKTVDDQMRALLPDNIEKEIVDRFITVGQLKEIPDLSGVSLLSLDVLGSSANVYPDTRGGVDGLLAEASSKIANVDILGGFATVGSIDLQTAAFANGVGNGAKANAVSKVIDANIGDALGIHATGADIQFVTDPVEVYNVIRKDAEALPDLEPQLTEVAKAAKLLLQIAGIDVELFETETFESPNGLEAWARAGSLKITVEPQLLNEEGLSALTSSIGSLPELNDSHFVSTGIRVAVTLPEAFSAVNVGSVQGFKVPPRTGLATPLLAGLMLIGGAITIRRYALAR